ncbi:MAG: RNA 2',3'-cyclic phosphodiesterase [Deltaproteobacteria bacterium]|nr:RNA 2',3'-cyclic phosphodiesterase [Deltaproteobacteria bacterium]
MEIRSFLAFELPAEIQRILSAVFEEARTLLSNVRWVRVANIHLTMVFMGNVPEAQLGPIGEAAGGVCREYAPFHIQLKGLGLFGSRRNPRVLWVGLGGDRDRMSCFRGDLQKALKPFGIKEEKRPFRPHLTLGRFRKGVKSGAHLGDLLAKYEDLNSPQTLLNELVLFRSDLNPGGAVYTKQRTWPLTG